MRVLECCHRKQEEQHTAAGAAAAKHPSQGDVENRPTRAVTARSNPCRRALRLPGGSTASLERGRSPARPAGRVRGRPGRLRVVGRPPLFQSKRTLRTQNTHRSPAAPGAGRRGPDALPAAPAPPGALTHGNMSRSTRSLAPGFVNWPREASLIQLKPTSVRPARPSAPPRSPAQLLPGSGDAPGTGSRKRHPPRPPQKSARQARHPPPRRRLSQR